MIVVRILSGLKNTIKKFEDFCNISYYRLEKNSGPGIARQYGLEKAKNDLITFIDSDDVFANPFSLDILRKFILRTPNCIAVFSSFFEQTRNRFIYYAQRGQNLDVW